MLGCKPIDTPIKQNRKLFQHLDATSIDKVRYQGLVEKLVNLSHAMPDIANAVCVASQFMHDAYKPHMDIVERILRYLKSAPGKGLMYTKHKYLKVEGYIDANWIGSANNRRYIMVLYFCRGKPCHLEN